MQDNSGFDQKIIALIRGKDQKTLAKIYQDVYPMVLKYVINNSGSEEDAQDIFHDAFYILIKKVDDKNFQLSSLLSTYLVGISKNLWLKKLTKAKLDTTAYHQELVNTEEFLEEVDSENLSKVKTIAEAISALGDPCRTLIVQYYYFKATMKEIAKMLEYTNADNAKNQKYKCLQRLKKMVLKVNE